MRKRGREDDVPLRYGQGGRQQRAARQGHVLVVYERARGHLKLSPLALILVFDWAWGRIRAPRLQQLATAAHDTELATLKRAGRSADVCDPWLKELGNIGRSGRSANHMHEQLVSILGEPTLPNPMEEAIIAKI